MRDRAVTKVRLISGKTQTQRCVFVRVLRTYRNWKDADVNLL